MVQELCQDDGCSKAYFRMSQAQTDNLLLITTTSYRESIGPAERLSICLQLVNIILCFITTTEGTDWANDVGCFSDLS